MKNRKFKKTAASFLLICSMLSGALFPLGEIQAATLSELREDQARIEDELESNRQKLEAMKEDTSRQREYKETLDAQADLLEKQIDSLYEEIRRMDEEIQAKNKEIAHTQSSIDKNVDLLKERLCAIYMLGEASNLQLILSADSMMDVAEKTELIRMIADHDMQLVQELAKEIETVSKQKAVIEENRSRVAEAKTQLDEKMAELEELQAEANRILEELLAKEEAVRQEQNALQQELDDAEDAIDEWFAQQEPQTPQAPQGPSIVGSGQFAWPTPGYTNITDYFGARGGAHDGLDIASYGIYGKPIVASDSGTVIFAQFGMPGSGYGGYGNVVVIDHGNGYKTLYAHCSSLAVSYGQRVTKGQVIGYVGNSGWSEGAHLHFEIRKNGVPQNPMNWFS